ncbi:altronate hydrolase [Deltaproteobacteria bacterium Smac51]|nr:altronate hydrolase [Deltaproteobacteria bacterium Smac51]
MSAVLKVNDKDNVVTCLKTLMKGETVEAGGQSITAAQDVPIFHKIAVTEIKRGELCYKYGQIIGRAITDIQPGDYVHVHNIESTRGRGDQVHS